jgi:ATP-dependent DNA ligase
MSELPFWIGSLLHSQQETATFIADGEIVAFKDGVTSFSKLQQRMQVEHPLPNLVRRVPVWLFLLATF